MKLRAVIVTAVIFLTLPIVCFAEDTMSCSEIEELRQEIRDLRAMIKQVHTDKYTDRILPVTDINSPTLRTVILPATADIGGSVSHGGTDDIKAEPTW